MFPTFDTGSVVSIRRRQGNWVIAGPHVAGIPPETRWLCIARAADGTWEWITSMQFGFGDITVVQPAPTYSPGTEFQHRHHGRIVVIKDRGDTVYCSIPERRVALSCGGFLNLGPGLADVSKAELVLANL
jgi:hypothetical protein